jgi:hypothetical protein
MAYNYDESYLYRHADSVKNFIQAWRNNQMLEWSVGTHREANGLKHFIRGLLANMDMNLAECKGIRADMRTTVYKSADGIWHVKLGRELAVTRGSMPKPQYDNMTAANRPAEPAPEIAGTAGIWPVPATMRSDMDIIRMVQTFSRYKAFASAEAKSTITISEMAQNAARGLGIKLTYEPGDYGMGKIIATRMNEEEKQAALRADDTVASSLALLDQYMKDNNIK